MIRARREAATVAVVIMLAVSAVSCTPSATSTPGQAGSGSIGSPLVETPAAGDPVPASPVTGILVGIQSSGLTQVTGFDLRTAAGEELTFRIGILENGAQFPPGHLAEHLATSTPVRVFFSVQEGDLVVYRLEDAS